MTRGRDKLDRLACLCHQLLDVQLASSLGLDYWQRWGFCMDSLISSNIFHFYLFQIAVIYNTLLNEQVFLQDFFIMSPYVCLHVQSSWKRVNVLAKPKCLGAARSLRNWWVTQAHSTDPLGCGTSWNCWSTHHTERNDLTISPSGGVFTSLSSWKIQSKRKICSSNGIGRRQADLLWLTSNTAGLEAAGFFNFLLSKHINSEPQLLNPDFLATLSGV